MKNYLGKLEAVRRFFKSEDGLVGVEWVALASGLVVAAVVIGVLTLDLTAGQAELIPGEISGASDTAVGAATNLSPYAGSSGT